jgi:hypothetical protein
MSDSFQARLVGTVLIEDDINPVPKLYWLPIADGFEMCLPDSVEPGAVEQITRHLEEMHLQPALFIFETREAPADER